MDCPKLKNRESGVVIDINESPFTIGRGLSCNYVIEQPAISRIHCILQKADDKTWFLQDMSSNGLYINGQLSKLKHSNTKVQLKTNDIIGFTPHKENYYIFLEAYDDVVTDEQLNLLADTAEFCFGESGDPDLLSAPTCPNVSSKAIETQPSCSKIETKPEQDNLEEMEDEMQCSICSEMFIKATTLNCSHTFCKFCIETWKKNKSICPICRAKITSQTPTLVLDNLIEKVVQNSSDEVKEHRKTILEDRKEQEQKQTAINSSNRGRNNSNRGRNNSNRGRSRDFERASAVELIWHYNDGRGRGGRGNYTGPRNNQGNRNERVPSVVNQYASTSVNSNNSVIYVPQNENNAAPQNRPNPVVIDLDTSDSSDSDISEEEDWRTVYDNIDWYDRIGNCFTCGRSGHWYRECPFN